MDTLTAKATISFEGLPTRDPDLLAQIIEMLAPRIAEVLLQEPAPPGAEPFRTPDIFKIDRTVRDDRIDKVKVDAGWKTGGSGSFGGSVTLGSKEGKADVGGMVWVRKEF